MKIDEKGVAMDYKVKQKKGLPLKEALFLGFCAVFILVTRAALRLKLGVPGHAMFFNIFFLLLARGCVSYRFSAIFTGFLAGVMAAVIGIGKGGPLVILKFIFPAIAIDIGAMIVPFLFDSYLLCALLGSIASFTKFFDSYFINSLTGMEKAVTVQLALLDTLYGVGFGIVGSLLIPPVIKKLRAYGVIEKPMERKRKLL
jgi:hypothetical protein